MLDMAQTAMTIRMDNDLKVQFDALCDEFGMSTNTSFNTFARTVVRNRRIPFIIEAPSKEETISKGKAASASGLRSPRSGEDQPFYRSSIGFLPRVPEDFTDAKFE